MLLRMGLSVSVERMRNEYSCGEVFEVMEDFKFLLEFKAH